MKKTTQFLCAAIVLAGALSTQAAAPSSFTLPETVTETAQEAWQIFQAVPAPIKKGVEQVVLMSWKILTEYQNHKGQMIPNQYKSALTIIQAATASLNAKPPSAQQKRVDTILNSVRNYALDEDMKACYQARVMDSAVKNAVTTGCNIFIAQKIVDQLNDDELRGILSHEMSHGDNGDLVKTYLKVAIITGGYFASLIDDEIIWAYSGKVGSTNQKLLDSIDPKSEKLTEVAKSLVAGNAALILGEFAQSTPLVEIHADQNGARLLNRAGYSAKSLKIALIKLYGLDPKDIDQIMSDQEGQKGLVRNYPSLYQRLQAIDAVAKF